MLIGSFGATMTFDTNENTWKCLNLVTSKGVGEWLHSSRYLTLILFIQGVSKMTGCF